MKSKIKNNRQTQQVQIRTDYQKNEYSERINPNAQMQTHRAQCPKEDKPIARDQTCFCQNIVQMKEQALDKASQMIELLYEEKNELEYQVQSLREVLQVKDTTISHLKQIIQQEIVKQESMTPQRQAEEETPRERSAVLGNDLFFSFSHPKSKQFNTLSTFDRGMYETKTGLNISKEFQPWQGHQNMIETLIEAISLEEGSVGEFRELGKLVSIEVERSEELTRQVQLQKEQLQDQLLLCETEQNTASEGKLTTQSETQYDCTQDLIKKYQSTIYGFRQYSGLLKACLCQATNFISKIGQFLTTITFQSSNSFTQLSSILNNFKTSAQPLTQINKQNHDLRAIIDGLLKNVEVLRSNMRVK